MKTTLATLISLSLSISVFAQSSVQKAEIPQSVIDRAKQNGCVVDVSCKDPVPTPPPPTRRPTPRSVVPPVQVVPTPPPVPAPAPPAQPINLNVTNHVDLKEFAQVLAGALQDRQVAPVQTFDNTLFQTIANNQEKQFAQGEKILGTLQSVRRWVIADTIIDAGNLGTNLGLGITSVRRLGGINKSVQANTQAVEKMGAAVSAMRPTINNNIAQNVSTEVSTDVDVSSSSNSTSNSNSSGSASAMNNNPAPKPPDTPKPPTPPSPPKDPKDPPKPPRDPKGDHDDKDKGDPWKTQPVPEKPKSPPIPSKDEDKH